MEGDQAQTDTYILAIDQGTTSSRVLMINHNLKVVDVAARDHEQISQKPGWVEHNPEEIYKNVVECLQEVCERNKLTSDKIASIGITN